MLMKKSTPALPEILGSLARSARARKLSDTEWAARAGLRKETLSRLRRRDSCDFATLDGLAAAVGARIAVVSADWPECSPDGHVPLQVHRDYEERLLDLCASQTLDLQRWTDLGPRFFMAGLAVMLASVPELDRRGLLSLAESLHPGASEPVVFEQWLKRSPVRPSRFLPMLAAEMKHAA
ncbi:hypothetical protein GCM10011488_54330 [Steroidobacter agaridevorans]|nr:hypothetical protein GCM10011488_54330 [Steroidobacter agaridevorans]